MIKHLLTFVFLFSICSAFSQAIELPPNPKTGKCYIKIANDLKENEWREVDCEFAQLTKDEKQLKTLQIKLHNLGYEVNVDGNLSDQTIESYHQYLKDENKRKRKARKSKIKKLKEKS